MENRSTQNPFRLQPSAFRLQLSAFCLQPSAFSLQPSASAFSLRIDSLPMRKIAFLLLFWTGTAFAADELVVIRAARLIDGRADSAISPAVVVVRGTRIESVGGAIPDGARMIDLGDSTLMPGLIDAHVHVMLQGDVTQEEYDSQLLKESLPYRALR